MGTGRSAGSRRQAGDPAAAGPDRPEGPPAPRPARRVGLLLAVAVAVLAADIASKATVTATLSGRSCSAGEHSASAPVWLLGGFLKLCESRNPGAAFSVGGPSETVVFTLIAVGVVIFIIRASRRINSLAWAVALGLLLGGATGNLTDRIFRAPGPFRGWVVDWIELPHWPVFNLADASIVCGGALIVLIAARGIRIDGTGPGPAAGRQPGPQPPPEGGSG